jgi:hypothetical protein
MQQAGAATHVDVERTKGKCWQYKEWHASHLTAQVAAGTMHTGHFACTFWILLQQKIGSHACSVRFLHSSGVLAGGIWTAAVAAACGKAQIQYCSRQYEVLSLRPEERPKHVLFTHPQTGVCIAQGSQEPRRFALATTCSSSSSRQARESGLLPFLLHQ